MPPLSTGRRGGRRHAACALRSVARRQPVQTAGTYFVHSIPQCAPYEPDGLLPEQLRRRLMSVRCFDSAHCLVSADVVQGDELMRVSAKMMENEKAEYIHVHYARPGCFAVRIDRA